MFSIHFYGSTESQTQTVPLVPIQTTITMSFCFISWVAQQEENAVRVEFPWQDYLCLKCYGDLHSKGFRKSHAPFCLVPCALCVVLPVPRTWRNSGHSGKGQGREIDIWYGSWGWVKTYYCHIWGHKHPLTRILGYLVCQGFDLYGWKLGTTNKKKMVHTGRWSTCVSQKSSEISNSKGMVACGLVQNGEHSQIATFMRIMMINHAIFGNPILWQAHVSLARHLGQIGLYQQWRIGLQWSPSPWVHKVY